MCSLYILCMYKVIKDIKWKVIYIWQKRTSKMITKFKKFNC